MLFIFYVVSVGKHGPIIIYLYSSSVVDLYFDIFFKIIQMHT